MKSGRRMRTATKLRRIYTYTILAWVLAILVFWSISALHTLSSTEIIDFSAYDPDSTIKHVIYFVLLVCALLVVLLLEFLIFGRRNTSGNPASNSRSSRKTALPIPQSPPRSFQARNRKPSKRRLRSSAADKQTHIEPLLSEVTQPPGEKTE